MNNRKLMNKLNNMSKEQLKPLWLYTRVFSKVYKKKLQRKEEGITLVALVITVVIMLILAGVVISVLTTDGGLFWKTRNAADAYSEAAQNEADRIQSLMNDIDNYLNGLPVGETDTTAPTVAIVEVSNIAETTFTLTATGEDETEIAKYEFYINGTLEKTVTTTEGTATYDVTGKKEGTTYTCKVRVYDKAGNYKDSSEISVTTKTVGDPIATKVKIGDYVNYDAGTWTVEDLTKITSSAGSPTLHSTVNDATTGNQAKPTTQGQFGGFEIGQSRNTNSKEYNTSYKPRAAGWRVWDINESTGEVRIISAGHPETYYHAGASGNTRKSMNILGNRDYSMYLNGHSYAKSAKMLTGQDAVQWYNKQYDSNYSVVEYNKDSTFHDVTFSTKAPIEVLEIGSYYWVASAATEYRLFSIRADERIMSWGMYDCALGIRILITLDANVLIDTSNGDGKTEATAWEILESGD